MSKEFLPTILKQKAKEVESLELEPLQPLRETYKLYDYLKNNANNLQVIAEVKKASPSLGDINLDVDIVKQAKTYQDSGAVMISVLTDPFFFKGNIDYLRQISSQVKIPTLAKDFIIDEKQIIRSRNAGATVVLLIVAALSEARLKELVTFETDINTSLELSAHFKSDAVYISESAIFTKEDASLVAPFFNGILVGTALMKADNVAEKVKELQVDKG